MAEDVTPEISEEDSPPKKGPGTIVWLILLVLAGGGGFAIPFLLSDSAPADDTEDQPADAIGMAPDEETIAVPFGEVTVNLDEGRMNRYLRLKLAVLISKSEEMVVTEAIAARSPILKNWLLSHLSDKTLEEIRGKAGLNMLRREIRTEFNRTLFLDHRDRVYDVLFEEFNVQ